jgi:hypothetical protein
MNLDQLAVLGSKKVSAKIRDKKKKKKKVMEGNPYDKDPD